MHAVAVIPARFDSVRFPGKVLADRTGKPLIRHVYERAAQATLVDRVVIAADDDRIAEAVHAFGGECIMTAPEHPNGTSRVAEVAESLDSPIIVNVQGDEPEIEPSLIDLAIRALIDDADSPVATVAAPFAPSDDPSDANAVKVVLDRRGRALYFSRSLVPFDRERTGEARPLRHVGLYAYRREFLGRYAALEPGPLEMTEKLEQLRVLEHGFRIAVAVAPEGSCSQGIDTPEQYEAFVRRWTAASPGAIA